MSFAAWLAAKHPMLIHVPVACGVLLPIALIAAQRPGRGIKPWRVCCRYLGWFGVLGGLSALVSGFLAAQQTGALPQGIWLVRDPQDPLRWHQISALASVLLGFIAIRSMYLRREEHEGLGAIALFWGLVWSGALLVTGWFGGRLSHPETETPKAAATTPAQPTPPPRPADPEAQVPVRALDFASLVPMHVWPVMSPPHGNRWIRVWVSPGAEDAYRKGLDLPDGSLVVMSTVASFGGRPAIDPGPLYFLEMKGGKPTLGYYWARVPERNRTETGGAERAYWRGDDSNLDACMECHAKGAAPARNRSQLRLQRRPKPEAAELPPPP